MESKWPNDMKVAQIRLRPTDQLKGCKLLL